NFNVKKYNYIRTLNSITYDTILTSNQDSKKGFFTRIGKAISGKSDILKEQLQVRIKMMYGNTEKIGSFEDQLKNTFHSIDKYYTHEFQRLNNTYNNLRSKDKELLEINKTILHKSKEILELYSESAQEMDKIKYTKAITNIESQKTLILTLLGIMAVITLILLAYTLFAYMYERNLSNAKMEAEKNLEFKNRIIGMLSHEMRAPLNIISNFSKKLKASGLPKEQTPTVNSLIFTSNSLQITVNQILDFFKNKSSKLAVYNSNFNLKEEILSVLESLRSLAEIKKIDLIMQLDQNLDTAVWADNVKIHQLFYNIIGNAIKFTTKGNITVTAKLLDTTDTKYRLNVTIKDTGSGIPAEDLENIFNEHYQSKFHSEQFKFGAGLGLNLCKEIVELFHGAISINSVQQKGTEVSFHLILDKPQTIKTSQEKLMAITELKKTTIAVVDDDMITLATVKKLITSVKAEAIGFSSAAEIRTYLQTNPVDLFITDLQLDSVSGIQLARDIKQQNEINAGIPILAITGDDYMTSHDIATTPFDDIILKPINKEEFYTKILKVLS
ncbi:MAG: hypothetical protein ABS44_21765, partial [Chryseobacterium sp. SCN 40-13]